jgi:hypothetical protein
MFGGSGGVALSGASGIGFSAPGGKFGGGSGGITDGASATTTTVGKGGDGLVLLAWTEGY